MVEQEKLRRQAEAKTRTPDEARPRAKPKAKAKCSTKAKAKAPVLAGEEEAAAEEEEEDDDDKDDEEAARRRRTQAARQSRRRKRAQAKPRLAVKVIDGADSWPLHISNWSFSEQGQLLLSCTLPGRAAAQRSLEPVVTIRPKKVQSECKESDPHEGHSLVTLFERRAISRSVFQTQPTSAAKATEPSAMGQRRPQPTPAAAPEKPSAAPPQTQIATPVKLPETKNLKSVSFESLRATMLASNITTNMLPILKAIVEETAKSTTVPVETDSSISSAMAAISNLTSKLAMMLPMKSPTSETTPRSSCSSPTTKQSSASAMISTEVATKKSKITLASMQTFDNMLNQLATTPPKTISSSQQARETSSSLTLTLVPTAKPALPQSEAVKTPSFTFSLSSMTQSAPRLSKARMASTSPRTSVIPPTPTPFATSQVARVSCVIPGSQSTPETQPQTPSLIARRSIMSPTMLSPTFSNESSTSVTNAMTQLQTCERDTIRISAQMTVARSAHMPLCSEILLPPPPAFSTSDGSPTDFATKSASGDISLNQDDNSIGNNRNSEDPQQLVQNTLNISDSYPCRNDVFVNNIQRSSLPDQTILQSHVTDAVQVQVYKDDKIHLEDSLKFDLRHIHDGNVAYEERLKTTMKNSSQFSQRGFRGPSTTEPHFYMPEYTNVLCMECPSNVRWEILKPGCSSEHTQSISKANTEHFEELKENDVKQPVLFHIHEVQHSPASINKPLFHQSPISENNLLKCPLNNALCAESTSFKESIQVPYNAPLPTQNPAAPITWRLLEHHGESHFRAKTIEKKSKLGERLPSNCHQSMQQCPLFNVMQVQQSSQVDTQLSHQCAESASYTRSSTQQRTHVNFSNETLHKQQLLKHFVVHNQQPPTGVTWRIWDPRTASWISMRTSQTNVMQENQSLDTSQAGPISDARQTTRCSAYSYLTRQSKSDSHLEVNRISDVESEDRYSICKNLVNDTQEHYSVRPARNLYSRYSESTLLSTDTWCIHPRQSERKKSSRRFNTYEKHSQARSGDVKHAKTGSRNVAMDVPHIRVSHIPDRQKCQSFPPATIRWLQSRKRLPGKRRDVRNGSGKYTRRCLKIQSTGSYHSSRVYFQKTLDAGWNDVARSSGADTCASLTVAPANDANLSVATPSLLLLCLTADVGSRLRSSPERRYCVIQNSATTKLGRNPSPKWKRASRNWRRRLATTTINSL